MKFDCIIDIVLGIQYPDIREFVNMISHKRTFVHAKIRRNSDGFLVIDSIFVLCICRVHYSHHSRRTRMQRRTLFALPCGE